MVLIRRREKGGSGFRRAERRLAGSGFPALRTGRGSAGNDLADWTSGSTLKWKGGSWGLVCR